ncbi:MAG: hypothetical protein HRT38_10450 [Alteromonadaceae bacterium]|nr:hypothetical protein [Alteromonadaceae bacterium]
MKQAYRSKINLSKIVKFTILLYISQVAIGFVFYELSLFKTVSEILSTKQFYWLEKFSMFMICTLVFYYLGKSIEYNRSLNAWIVLCLTIAFSYVVLFLFLKSIEPILFMLDFLILLVTLVIGLTLSSKSKLINKEPPQNISL